MSIGNEARKPIGWDSDEEWELEQKCFHWNERWSVEDTRELINELWFQYCNAANPDRPSKANGDKDE